MFVCGVFNMCKFISGQHCWVFPP